ncbi:MAG: hypothetical protein AAF349_20420 [Cyanobacteria bacterium P01_A01_bin.68]
MIFLLNNYLIPWTLSLLMVCIASLGVNLTDIDITQPVNDINSAQLSPLPKPSGDYSVGTVSYYFVDSHREEIYTPDPNDRRELMVRVWYPSEKLSGGNLAPYLSKALIKAIALSWDTSTEDLSDSFITTPTHSIINAPIAQTKSNYPVLLFSHGFGILPEFNTINAEQLASQGYVVVSINHTYDSAASIFPNGRVITQSPVFYTDDKSKFMKLLKQSVGVRAKDASFILDKLTDINAGKNPSGILTGKLDLDRVGMLGHSLGGATTVQTLLQDKRFKAGVHLDGGLFINGVNKSLNQPFMFINSELLGTGNTSNPDFQEAIELQKTFFQQLQSYGYKVTIKGTGHFYFNDLPFILPELKNAKLPLPFTQFENWVAADNSNPINPDRAIKIINDYTVAFFNKYLNHEKSSLLKIKPSSLTYPEVIFEFRKGEDVTSTHYPSSVTFR